jgi:transposase
MKKVRDTDCRCLDHKTLTELRKRAVAQVLAGESPEIVARALGINRTTIYDWLALYRKGGWGALEAKKRGGRRPKLSGRALKWIFDTITMKDPLQLKFSFALWACDMIRKLIFERLGVKLSKASVNRLLHQIGLSPQRPLWRAYQQNPEAVKQWLKKEFPAIRKEAQACGAEIYFVDEAGVRSDHHGGTTWSKVGVTPVVVSTGARFGFNIISAVSPRGTLRFRIVEGSVNAGVFLDFLKRLLVGAKRPVYVIADGHPSHKAKKVKKWIESTGGKLIRSFFRKPSTCYAAI